jgi:hypothetical protein
MPFRKRRCKKCKKTDVYLSRAGYCVDCSMQKCAASGIQIKNKKGPVFEKWKLAMKKYLDEEKQLSSD